MVERDGSESGKSLGSFQEVKVNIEIPKQMSSMTKDLSGVVLLNGGGVGNVNIEAQAQSCSKIYSAHTDKNGIYTLKLP
jgi:hypothetical protein